MQKLLNVALNFMCRMMLFIDISITISGMASRIWWDQLCFLIVVIGTANIILTSTLSPSLGPASSETRNVHGPGKNWREGRLSSCCSGGAGVQSPALICGRLSSVLDPRICFEGWIMRLHDGQDRLRNFKGPVQNENMGFLVKKLRISKKIILIKKNY